MRAIETEKLTKYYGKARGVEELDLSVEQGEFFGFIGPNGAGKSTTIRSLLGYISPTSGSARVLGLDTAAQRREILARVGYLPSEAVFYRGMRVKEVIALSAALRKMDCRQEAAALCGRLELDTEKKVDELSFGNRKKLAIVCAFQHRPDLYILDEPTSGLDPLMQREFFALLQERHREGASVFLSSHILSEIQRYCSRAAIIRQGRIIACGSVEELGQTGAKRVSLHGQAELQGLTGIKDLQRGGESLSFLYSGDLHALLERLARGRVKDLSIAEPDLEEIFMHYYSGEGDEQ